MNFVKHPSNNLLLTAPKGMDNCENLPATQMKGPDNQPIIASFWTPTPEERVRVAHGKPIVLYVWGTSHPPVSLGVDE